ncbi:MAG TPA: flavin reductase family protein [Burkholderiales bacterium]|jgi:flavin reductase (DIM6/NTAB) family NADH-FMN oxidoreductase RutF|nr:flavin reductase family protein [Burkholderiales bacterium]
MSEFISIDATGLDTATAYRLIIGCVTPRPVAWVTTVSSAGCVNAAPFSSYNYVAHSPPMLAINIGTRDGRLKDTARNIVDTGEFVVNVPTEASMELMHATSAEYPSGVSEAEELGIALLPGVKGQVPRIAVSPIHMECRLERAITLGRGLNTLYIGEVTAFHLSPEVFDGRRVDSVRMRPIARLGGPYYTALGEIFCRPVLQTPPK